MQGIVAARTQTGHTLPAFVTPDDKMRFLACLPTKKKFRAPAFASVNPIIPRSEWVEYDRHRTTIPILDQGQEGSCVAHGWDAQVMRARDESGQDFHLLSRAFLYALINNGADSGADPADAAHVLATVGICTEATVPYRFLVAGQISQAARDEAARFKLEPNGIYELNSFDELVSAELLGYKCGTTVYVAGDWNTLDSNGCPPAYRGYGNHWMSTDSRLKKTSRGNWLVGMIQSWGINWGNGGLCYFHEGHFNNQPGLQMYAIRYSGQDPLDSNLPPILA